MARPEASVRFLLTVLDADACEVAFEPEGQLLTLASGDAFTVEVTGPGDGVVEVSYVPTGIIIGAWSGASTSAWNKAGEPLKL